jgi:CBS domain-containing protein
MEAARLLISENFESLVVLGRDNRAVGVFGWRELIGAYTRLGANTANLQTLILADTMCSEIPTVPPNIPAITAAQIMFDQGLRHIYVMHPTKDSSVPNLPVAVLSLGDVVREIANE